jgi:hypothetical protein
VKKPARRSEKPPGTKLVKASAQDVSIPDFVKVEKNLASLGFFTPPKKEIKKARSKTIRFTRNIGESRVEAEVRISADEDLGLPTTADQDKYLAFQKLVSDYIQKHGEISNPFNFQSADILNLLDLADSGENFREIERWLDRMTATTIISRGAVYFAGKRRWATDRFHVFSRAVSIGKDLGDGSIADRNYVWLSEWQLENIVNNYLLPVDFEAYKQIGNHIAKALVPLLQIWLYASREDGFFEKRYDELCQILHLTQYEHASKIREKIGPALDELKEKGYISDWKVEPASDRKNFKVVFYHGEKFHDDRRRRSWLPDAEAEDGAEEGGAESERLPFGPPEQESSPAAEHSQAERGQLVERLCREFRVARERAEELVTKYPQSAREQVEAWQFRESKPENPAGWIIKAIEKSYELPPTYVEAKNNEQRQSRKAARAAAIAACPFCRDSEGWRFTSKGARPCTHEPAKESSDADLL